jgi:RimJ/RimL family protein N-acetyltransferase
MDWREAGLQAGAIEVRPWRDGDDVGTSPDDPVTGRYFGLPLGDTPPLDVDDPGAPRCTIFRDGEPVGRIWCRPGARPLELGYYVRTELWGQGIASTALRLLADWLLGDGGHNVLVLATHAENVASQKVAERAGFTRDGEIQEYAAFKDGTTTALRFVRR